MIGLEAVGMAVLQALAAESSDAGTGFLRRHLAGGGRAERLAAYRTLEDVVLRARLRVDLLLALHTARLNPLNVPAQAAAFSVIASSLDRTLVDLSDALSAWRRLRAVGNKDVIAAADHLMVALAELLKHVDPGWHRPRKRKSHRHLAAEAQDAYNTAIANFDKHVQADTAPHRAERRRLRRELVEVTD
jgi:hypothetical protein